MLFKILDVLHIKHKGGQSHSSDLLIPHTALKKPPSRSTPVATTIATALATQEAPTDFYRAIDSKEISELEIFLSLGSASSASLPLSLDTPLPTTTPTFQEPEEDDEDDEEDESTITIPSALRAKPVRRSIEYQQLIEALKIDKIKSAQDIAGKIPLIKKHHINDLNIRLLIKKLINHMNKSFKEDPKYPKIVETLDALSRQIRNKKATI